MTKRVHWINLIEGGRGSNDLQGTAGRDLIVGNQGDDRIQGGAGDDVLYGDAKGTHGSWDWGKCVWWAPHASGNDFLDGGAGSDKVFGGHGNDVAVYSMAGNLGANFADIGAHDVYDGGKGFDTLVLQLTYGENALGSVQKDITAFEAFLAARANPHSEHGKTFHFQSFDLDARNFEALRVELVNGAPVARDDAAATNEDTPLSIAARTLLANDSDPDHLDVIKLTGASTQSAHGAVITLGADGSLTYDPSAAHELQQLADGETLVDSFNYTIADLAGATSTASVQITVTGANDAPQAHDDAVVLPVSSGGGSAGPEVHLITFEGATDAGNVDGFSFAGFSIYDKFGVDFSYMAGAGTNNDNVGGGSDADGAVRLAAGGDFAVLSLSMASLFVEPTVNLVGYKDGSPVQDAHLQLTLNAGFQTIDFGAAWSSIDELRFYGQVSDVPVDYLLIDNLKVAVAGSGGGGAPHAAPIDINVLANDTDVDHGDVLKLLSFDDTSKMGAAISLNADGTLHYDPTGIDLPTLAPGETATDSFHYTVADAHGATSSASASVDLLGTDDLAHLASATAPDANLL